MKGKRFLWKINKDYANGDTSDISTTTCNSKRSQDTAIEVVGQWLVSTSVSLWGWHLKCQVL